MRYLWSRERISCCAYCDPPSLDNCADCKQRVNARYPAKEVRINKTKYVREDSEVEE